ncbi:hypothetical protein EaACW_pEA290028 (plasmid) [Erwinia amylovora ACW56400]|uniref:Uncharacterized protein n=1 Tax=Erwinia amylovora NBRC 12687 = CFBP 1232 TaxID=1219359 RepID=A0A830ZX31_ERWAM|nr:hypothetical protein EaACW_pEA290028 [Erwinia amylovora ACW56400]CCO80619.1 hypothetical protein BN432_pEA290028 [Erwinia amylovora Ea356]CCO84435.1 hypothetical protein BN433_pEA290028 [Erwinia amylovora Ea266]CCO91978.1 hypothetical protein BN435_pEA290028 [Erwinia amylovora 01SFR-BO]CCO95772.1 hypothetical protein BN437_pEA290028 [Erwinia amylovora NBRC 12687 = CFBP 1232]
MVNEPDPAVCPDGSDINNVKAMPGELFCFKI